jgi:hypothetical protein
MIFVFELNIVSSPKLSKIVSKRSNGSCTPNMFLVFLLSLRIHPADHALTLFWFVVILREVERCRERGE